MKNTTGVNVSFDNDLLLRLRDRARLKQMAFSPYVCELLENALSEDRPKAEVVTPAAQSSIDKKDVMRMLRDGLKSCKLISPIKTELVAVLTAILKETPTVDEPPAGLVPFSPPADASWIDDGSVHPDIKERQAKKRQELDRGGMQHIGKSKDYVIDAMVRRTGVTPEQARKTLEAGKIQPRECGDVSEPPEPEEDLEDWHAPD